MHREKDNSKSREVKRLKECALALSKIKICLMKMTIIHYLLNMISVMENTLLSVKITKSSASLAFYMIYIIGQVLLSISVDS